MHKNKKNNKRKNKNKNHAKSDLVNGHDRAEVTLDSGPPYELRKSEECGRYLVASRDLHIGELLVSAAPLVVGPCQGSPPICLGCFLKLDTQTASTCRGCAWLMCSDHCPGIDGHVWHSPEECQLLSTASLKPANDTLMRYHCIVPLRCLLLKTHAAAQWQLLMTMEPLNELRSKMPHWRTNQREIVDRIRNLWGIKQFEEDEIHTICGILEVNAFEVGQHGVSVRALYPEAFYLMHECVPNTCHTDGDAFLLTVRTSQRIARGQPITLSYAYTLQGTLKRREHLLESKFFECCCARCADPTELGTYAGALKCPRCTNGNVLSTAPLDAQAPWRCVGSHCPGYEASAESVSKLMDRIFEEVKAVDVNDVSAYETLLSHYLQILHPNHYHCLWIKHSLSQLYGKSEDFHINQMTQAQLTRKRDVCRELLAVIDILEPGYSRLRGMTLYELHAPIMLLTQREFEQRTLSKQQLRARLREVVTCLEEASQILGFEPKDSPEGGMGEAAGIALERIREWQRAVGE